MNARGADIACTAAVGLLAGAVDGVPLPPTIAEHVGGCLRCQSELVHYRRVLRGLRSLRDQCRRPPSGALELMLGALDLALSEAPGRSTTLGTRRLAYLGGLAAATAAGAAGALVLGSRLRRRAG